MKREAEIDWDKEKKRRALLQKIVAGAGRVMELARQAQERFPADSPQRQGIRGCRQNSLVQSTIALIWQMARKEAVLLA